MADNLSKQRENVTGPWYVDTSCGFVAALAFRLHPSGLKNFICVFLMAPMTAIGGENAAHHTSPAAEPFGAAFDVHAAERFAKLALACVHKEYPNKISHVLNSDADVAPPQKLTPAFYGCYD